MSTNINANALKTFIQKDLGINKLTEAQAKKYDIDPDKFTEANVDENEYLDLNEILEDSDLYEQFATLYVEEQDKEAATNNAEKEKEEEAKVKDKNQSGV